MDYLYYKEYYLFDNFNKCKTKCIAYECRNKFKKNNAFIYKILTTNFKKYNLGNIDSKYQPFTTGNNFKIKKIDYVKDPCDELYTLVFVLFKNKQSTRSITRSSNLIYGLSFNKKIYKNVNIEIKNFANIPLDGNGSQFRFGNFTFPSNSKNKPQIINGTSLKKCFYQQNDFNENISKWETSGVVNMVSIFQGCTNFNSKISNWNIENVTSLQVFIMQLLLINH